MILTLTETETGQRRLYATRFATVVTYFTESDDGGVALQTEPGWAAMPHEYVAAKEAVREVVLMELAARLSLQPAEVLQQRFTDLAAIADPDLPTEYRYAARTRSRTRSYSR